MAPRPPKPDGGVPDKGTSTPVPRVPKPLPTPSAQSRPASTVLDDITSMPTPASVTPTGTANFDRTYGTWDQYQGWLANFRTDPVNLRLVAANGPKFTWWAWATRGWDQNAQNDDFFASGWKIPDDVFGPGTTTGRSGGGGGRSSLGGGGGGGSAAPTPEQIAATAATIKNKAATMGLPLDEASINSLAEVVLRDGWSADMLEEYMATGLGGNPTGAQAGDFTSNKDKLRQLADIQGVALDEASLDQWAERMVSGEMDDAGAQSMILAMAKATHPEAAAALDRGITYHDFALALGPAKDAARQYAAAQLLPITDETAAEWAGKVASGEWDQATLQSNVAHLASNRFQWAAPAIAAGMTVRDYVLPSRDKVASELEMSPNGIDLMDSGWQSMMYVTDDKGVQRLSTDSELVQMARKRPEFVKTKKAQDSASELALAIRDHFEGRG